MSPRQPKGRQAAGWLADMKCQQPREGVCVCARRRGAGIDGTGPPPPARRAPRVTKAWLGGLALHSPRIMRPNMQAARASAMAEGRQVGGSIIGAFVWAGGKRFSSGTACQSSQVQEGLCTAGILHPKRDRAAAPVAANCQLQAVAEGQPQVTQARAAAPGKCEAPRPAVPPPMPALRRLHSTRSQKPCCSMGSGAREECMQRRMQGMHRATAAHACKGVSSACLLGGAERRWGERRGGRRGGRNESHLQVRVLHLPHERRDV